MSKAQKKAIPLSLYIHIPWCQSKCPYCDFNSYPITTAIPAQEYCQKLLADLESDLPKFQNRPLSTIFFGGGTPSLLPPRHIASLIEKINTLSSLAEKNSEITLEANPGTVTKQQLAEFRHTGINRLSIGVQSFQNDKLQLLGRIHDQQTAIKTIEAAQAAGFSNINIDLMYGVPQQSVTDALLDIKKALALNPTHLSWYQLTIEPNTPFAATELALPSEETIWEIERYGKELITETTFKQYEISAYSKPGYKCQHNLNYWLFGDYLGIGAGAHGKITALAKMQITRYQKLRHPANYLHSPANSLLQKEEVIQTQELALEFMLNSLRLQQAIPLKLFTERTGLPLAKISEPLNNALKQQLITRTNTHIATTSKGKAFLNDLLQLFITP